MNNWASKKTLLINFLKEFDKDRTRADFLDILTNFIHDTIMESQPDGYSNEVTDADRDALYTVFDNFFVMKENSPEKSDYEELAENLIEDYLKTIELSDSSTGTGFNTNVGLFITDYGDSEVMGEYLYNAFNTGEEASKDSEIAAKEIANGLVKMLQKVLENISGQYGSSPSDSNPKWSGLVLEGD